MKKIKEILFSESGMKVVNTLFFLSVIFYRSGLLFIAYIAWIAYLAFCIKHTDSKGSKIVYALNGGTVGGKDSLAYHYEPVGTMVTLPVAEPQKDGLAFAGWQISDGTSTYYMAGESFKVPDTAQLTVTAVFKDTMTLTIDNSFVYYNTINLTSRYNWIFCCVCYSFCME